MSTKLTANALVSTKLVFVLFICSLCSNVTHATPDDKLALENAMKYFKHFGGNRHVTYLCERESSGCEISCSDSGTTIIKNEENIKTAYLAEKIRKLDGIGVGYLLVINYRDSRPSSRLILSTGISCAFEKMTLRF